jgi:hypothetical protein
MNIEDISIQDLEKLRPDLYTLISDEMKESLKKKFQEGICSQRTVRARTCRGKIWRCHSLDTYKRRRCRRRF